tara:strand:+ start:123 stop:437 length:315 start_codon:yes stop_codon:yes gene_type:complete
LLALSYRAGVDKGIIACYNNSIFNNRERFYMWYDSEVYGGSKKSNVAAEDIYYGPTNKKNDPCSTCPMAATCQYECKAFTAWCDTGNFADDTVGVFKKTAKKVA